MYSIKSVAVAVAACGLVSLTEGHILMATPVRAASPAVTNGPLLPDGSNFPCQMKPGDTLSGETTPMPLGSDQPLNFIGQSVHGGGSCQVSITYDENPTASSVWKTVTSIEGGCPAQNAEGNLGDDTSATAPVPYDYNFTLPDNIPSGKAVLAWTWFNKVGNREMYMNCALVELTGSSGDKSNFEALPDMFTANIDNNGCSTEDDSDLVFPNPGANLQKLNGATTKWGTTVGSCKTGSPSQPTGGPGAHSSPTADVVAGSAPTPAPAGGIFATVGSSTPTSPPAAPTPTGYTSTSPGTSSSGSSGSVPADTGATTNSGSSSSGSSSGSSASQSAGSACATEGDFQCVDSTSYQVCASGAWSSVMPVAPGTTCSGNGAKFEIAAAAGKFRMTRALRRVRRSLPFFG